MKIAIEAEETEESHFVEAVSRSVARSPFNLECSIIANNEIFLNLAKPLGMDGSADIYLLSIHVISKLIHVLLITTTIYWSSVVFGVILVSHNDDVEDSLKYAFLKDVAFDHAIYS